MPSAMGEVMGTLLLMVDAWFEFASEAAPDRYQPSDRVEVLGQLVRLLGHRFHGFRDIPRNEDVTALLNDDSVGLRIRSPGPVPPGTSAIERQLLRYGFRVKSVAGTNKREVILTCGDVRGAKVLAFPTREALSGRRKKNG